MMEHIPSSYPIQRTELPAENLAKIRHEMYLFFPRLCHRQKELVHVDPLNRNFSQPDKNFTLTRSQLELHKDPEQSRSSHMA